MPEMIIPDIKFMPSFIDGLKNGYRLDNLEPIASEEIFQIESNPETFFQNFIQRKTNLIVSPDSLAIAPIRRSEFWYTEGEEFIGRLNIRHALDNELSHFAGNIGYEVVPKHQNKGNASAMLQWGLDFCRRETGLEKVLLTVSDTNFPSIRVIEKNGGILEDKTLRPDKSLQRRYWINL